MTAPDQQTAREIVDEALRHWQHDPFLKDAHAVLDDRIAKVLTAVRADARREEREACARIVLKLADPIVLATVMPSLESPLGTAALLKEIAAAIRNQGPA